MWKITLVLHHGGIFTKNEADGKLEYVGGELDVWDKIETNYLNFFLLTNLVKHCRKYNNVGDIHWVVDKEVDLEEGLRVCETDFDIQDMVISARHNGDEVELYYDHKVDEQPILFEADVPEDGLSNLNPIPEVEEEGDKDDGDVGIDDNNGVDVNTNGEEQEDIASEEHDDIDGDEDVDVDVRVGREWWSDIPEYNDEVQEDEAEPVGYESEKLDSPRSSNDEGGFEKEVFPQFNECSKFGNVLEVGMEFSNLEIFKETVRDYTIELGRDIKWKKNDAIRARAKCREPECDWEIFCISACFISNSDEMEFEDVVSAIDEDQLLQPDQLYFALPLSLLRHPLQPHEMAALAIKASSALMKTTDKCGSRRK
ncbi:hypothetical protein GmHk_04G011133 [Glycine max]|nr:hypothetical protein GmHk_04G011133 [Glycine max]